MSPKQDRYIEELYHTYFRKLIIYATASLHNSERAQDVVQDTFHEAVLHVDTLINHPNPGGWLMNTVKNRIRENERQRNRYIQRFLSLESELLREPASYSGSTLSADVIDNMDDVFTVEKIKQVLTEEEYKILKRLILDHATHLQVAQELGITVYASQKRLERIRKKLYKVFPERKRK